MIRLTLERAPKESDASWRKRLRQAYDMFCERDISFETWLAERSKRKRGGLKND